MTKQANLLPSPVCFPVYAGLALGIAICLSSCQAAEQPVADEFALPPTPTRTPGELGLTEVVIKPAGWSNADFKTDLPDGYPEEMRSGLVEAEYVRHQDRSREPLPSQSTVTILIYENETLAKDAYTVWVDSNEIDAPGFQISTGEGPDGGLVAIMIFDPGEPENELVPRSIQRKIVIQQCKMLIDYTFNISEIGEFVTIETQDAAVQRTAQNLRPFACDAAE